MLLTRHPDKRALARTLGAAETAARPRGGGADLAAGCGPDARMRRGRRDRGRGAFADAERRPGGGARGAAEGRAVAIEPFDLLFREVQLRFAFINPFTQARAAELISSGRIAVAPLISRTIPLEAAASTIAGPPMPGEVKVLVVPSGA